MKLSSSLIALSLVLCSTAALAADKPAETSKAAKPAKTTKAEKAPAKPQEQNSQVALTGSYIKRNARRNGIVTDGPNPLVVLDNEAIRNTGAADLRELLIFRGVAR
jgi:hypothetical protein